MSGNFLVNLAYRAAGLTPVVRARAEPALLQGGEDAAAAAAGDGATPAQVALPPTASSPPVITQAVAPAVPVAGPVLATAAVGSVAQPVLQRLAAVQAVMPASVMPATARSETPATQLPATALRPADTTAPVAAHSTVVDSPLIVPRIQALVQPNLHVEAPPRISAASSQSAPTEPVLLPITERVVEAPRRDTHTVERLLEPASAPAPAAQILSLGPAPLPQAPRQAAALPTTHERVIQVRIGAIEIHAVSPAPRAAAPAAPVATQMSAPGGFDSYSRLRSYAPWEW